MNIGDPMPDVSLLGEDGVVGLRSKIADKALVVYFYPKDETYGCTIEACAFRDAYTGFTDAGADVIGISRDDAASHASFKKSQRLPFTLLTDVGGKVARSWGVASGLLAGRTTFIFDKAGILRHKFESRIRFGKHVDEALATVKKLASEISASV